MHVFNQYGSILSAYVSTYIFLLFQKKYIICEEAVIFTNVRSVKHF